MELIYIVDLVSSIASYKKVFEKFEEVIKEGKFKKNLLEKIFITLIGKYSY